MTSPLDHCMLCAHSRLSLITGVPGDSLLSCDAYPTGIPARHRGSKHDQIEADQVGTLTFLPMPLDPDDDEEDALPGMGEPEPPTLPGEEV